MYCGRSRKDFQSVELIIESKCLAPYGVQAKLWIYKFGIWILRNSVRNFGYPGGFSWFLSVTPLKFCEINSLSLGSPSQKKKTSKSLIISDSVSCNLIHKITTENLESLSHNEQLRHTAGVSTCVAKILCFLCKEVPWSRCIYERIDAGWLRAWWSQCKFHSGQSDTGA